MAEASGAPIFRPERMRLTGGEQLPIDASGLPLEAQRQEAIAKRRIGLGMTGLRYGSIEAAERAGDWARQISRTAYLASAHFGGGEGTPRRPGRGCGTAASIRT